MQYFQWWNESEQVSGHDGRLQGSVSESVLSWTLDLKCGISSLLPPLALHACVTKTQLNPMQALSLASYTVSLCFQLLALTERKALNQSGGRAAVGKLHGICIRCCCYCCCCCCCCCYYCCCCCCSTHTACCNTLLCYRFVYLSFSSFAQNINSQHSHR